MALNHDDEKTVIPPPLQSQGNALAVGTRVAEFEIRRLIGEGGFGIVYDAYDHSLQRRIALKEYMPSALAARTQGLTVAVKSERHRDTFEAGLKSFVNEAQLLAQFDHPCLVKVYRFWEANGTAYMVMPLYEGPTLKQARKEWGEPPQEAWIKNLLANLLDALETIHRHNCFHRDIAPDNILLLKDGRPLLLDFGAARRVIGDITHALTVILKPGYAPVEQYAEMPESKQGPWTDIYALGAVVYFVIIGRAPEPSVARLMQDKLTPLSEAAAGRYSERFLRAIDRALTVKPEDRPQNVAELRQLLALKETAGAAHFVSLTASPKPLTKRRLPFIGAMVAIMAAALVAGFFLVFGSRKPEHQLPPSPPVSASDDAVRTSKSPMMPSEKTEQSLQNHLAIPPPLKAFDPIAVLDQIFEARDRDHALTVVLDKAHVKIGKDRLRFRLRSSRSGYLYILMVGTDRTHFNLLFPNAVDSENRIEADKEVYLPRPGWSMVASGPPGNDQFLALVSVHPRDFSEAGLKKIDPFAEFPLADAAKVAQVSGAPAFAGKPVCPVGRPCSKAYGAAIFTIDETQ